MTWRSILSTYSQEQEGESWQTSYWGISRSALSRLRNTRAKCSCNGSVTVCCPHFQSGMMCALFDLITRRRENTSSGCDLSQADSSSRAASPARTYPVPARAKGSPAPDRDSGVRWQELFVRFDPATSTWKTHQCLWEEDLQWSSVTLPKWGIMRDGVLLERTTPALPIGAKGFGLWPTPLSRDHKSGKCSQDTWDKNSRPLNEAVLHGGTSTRQTWPTPTNSMVTAADMEQARFAGNSGKRPKYQDAKKIWPTPQSRDFRTGEGHRWDEPEKRSRNLNDQAAKTENHGQLNPSWVEWLMGFPIGWTNSKPLATDKFQRWLRSHGVSWRGREKTVDPAGARGL